jgi:hypothetical protein
MSAAVDLRIQEAGDYGPPVFIGLATDAWEIVGIDVRLVQHSDACYYVEVLVGDGFASAQRICWAMFAELGVAQARLGRRGRVVVGEKVWVRATSSRGETTASIALQARPCITFHDPGSIARRV